MDRKLHSIPIFSSSVFITLSFQQIYYYVMIITLKFTKQKRSYSKKQTKIHLKESTFLTDDAQNIIIFFFNKTKLHYGVSQKIQDGEVYPFRILKYYVSKVPNQTRKCG